MDIKTKNRIKRGVQGFSLICIIVFLVLIFILAPIFLHLPSVGFNTEKIVKLENWEMTIGDGVRTEVKLPAPLKRAGKQPVVLYNRFSDDLIDGSSLCIRSAYQSIVIRCNGEILYQWGGEAQGLPSSLSGNLWNIVRIPDEYAGQEYTIELTALIENYTGFLNEIWYGSKSAILYALAVEYGFGLSVSIFLIVIGIVLIAMQCVMRAWKRHDFTLFNLGCFSLFVSLWLLGESKMLQFLTGNLYIVYYLSFIALMIFPLPLIVYLSRMYKPHHYDASFILFCAFLINFVVSMILQLTGVVGFYQLLASIHLLIWCMIVYFVFSMFYETIRYKNANAKQQLYMVCLLGIFGVMEFIDFYFIHSNHISHYFRIGLLIYIIVLGVMSFRKMRTMEKAQRERNYFERLAYSDLLTGGGNRTAYYRAIEKLEHDKQESICVALFDINGLKVINDKYGHLSGDRAIQDAFRCISESFGLLGTCYRIGGDEFSCIMKNVELSAVEQAKQHLVDIIGIMDAQTEYHFAIAVGFAFYNREQDANFEEACVRADKDMYENKHVMKSAYQEK